MYAHYYATKSSKVLIVGNSVRPVGTRIAVSGKKEAKKIAAEKGAQCWNF